MFSEQVKVEQVELPGRVDDVTLFVLLRVKQHDDTPETQIQSASLKIKQNKTKKKTITARFNFMTNISSLFVRRLKRQKSMLGK